MTHVVFGEDLELKNGILLHNPTILEVRNFGEFNYLYLIALITMRAYDDAVNLYDAGINYKEVSDFLIFMRNMKSVSDEFTHLIFPNVSLNKFNVAVTEENQEMIFTDGDIVIDEAVYRQIMDFVRGINYIEEKVELDMADGANNMRFFIERMRHKQKRRAKHKPTPFLSNLISSMVCTADFPYDYDSIQRLHISQLYNGFYRKDKSDSSKFIRQAIYAGTIDRKQVSNTMLNWYGDLKSKQ